MYRRNMQAFYYAEMIRRPRENIFSTTSPIMAVREKNILQKENKTKNLTLKIRFYKSADLNVNMENPNYMNNKEISFYAS